MKIKTGADPTFDPVSRSGYFMKRGSAKPGTTRQYRVNELNTQRYATGTKQGTVSGQGPALDTGRSGGTS